MSDVKDMDEKKVRSLVFPKKSSIAETMNMREISLSNLKDRIIDSFVCRDENGELVLTPILILGPTGIGKTEAIVYIVKELSEILTSIHGRPVEVGYKQIRLPHHSEIDLAGLMYRNPATNLVEYANNNVLPNAMPEEYSKTKSDGFREAIARYKLGGAAGLSEQDRILVEMLQKDMAKYGISEEEALSKLERYATCTDEELGFVGEYGILVLDEITSSSPALQQLAYSLLDTTRGVAKYRLPKNWLVIASGNGESDGGHFVGMQSALLNRAMCYRIKPDFNSWREWALRQGVHPTVLHYLTSNREFLHVMPENPEDAALFPTPRAWVNISSSLLRKENYLTTRYREDLGRHGFDRALLNTEDVEVLVAGFVGDGLASGFATHYALNREIQSVEEILASGSEKGSFGSYTTAQAYLLLGQIARRLRLMLLELEAKVESKYGTKLQTDMFSNISLRDSQDPSKKKKYYSPEGFEEDLDRMYRLLSWAVTACEASGISDYGIQFLYQLDCALTRDQYNFFVMGVWANENKKFIFELTRKVNQAKEDKKKNGISFREMLSKRQSDSKK